MEKTKLEQELKTLEEKVNVLKVKLEEEIEEKKNKIEEKKREIKAYEKLTKYNIDYKSVEERIPKLKEDMVDNPNIIGIDVDLEKKIAVYLIRDSNNIDEENRHPAHFTPYIKESVTLYILNDKELIRTRTYVHKGRFINGVCDETAGNYHDSPELDFTKVEILDVNETELKMKLTTSPPGPFDSSEPFRKLITLDLKEDEFKDEIDLDRNRYRKIRHDDEYH